MLPIRPEYDALAGFPLVWRWTRSTHDLLTPEELALIRPLKATTARDVWDHALKTHQGARCGHQTLILGEEGPSEEHQVRHWLDKLPVAQRDPILLCWSADIAVEATWALYVRRWSAFWYPATDDLDVLPMTGAWALRISHSGRFEWTSSGAE